jgi:hypothetical protein
MIILCVMNIVSSQNKISRNLKWLVVWTMLVAWVTVLLEDIAIAKEKTTKLVNTILDMPRVEFVKEMIDMEDIPTDAKLVKIEWWAEFRVWLDNPTNIINVKLVKQSKVEYWTDSFLFIVELGGKNYVLYTSHYEIKAEILDEKWICVDHFDNKWDTCEEKLHK